MADKWITYFGTGHRSGKETKFTRLASESVPMRMRWGQRLATEEEIAEEKAAREQKKREEGVWLAFRSRPEYVAATAIRDRLEWMNPDSHPLDALTVKEWKELQQKLTE